MLTTQRAAEKLNLIGLQYSPQDLAELARKGVLIGSEKSGNIWLIPERALDQFIAQQKNVESKPSNVQPGRQERPLREFLRDPVWQGVGAIAGVIAIIPIVWGLFSYFTPPEPGLQPTSENLGSNVTIPVTSIPTLTRSPTVQAIAATSTSMPSPTATATEVAATITPVPTLGAEDLLTHAKQWPIIFMDNFKQRSINWTDSDGVQNPEVSLSLKNGRLNIEINTEDKGVTGAFYSQTATPDDFYVTMDAVVDEGGTNCYYGLLFRGNIEGDYYSFRISPYHYRVDVIFADADRSNDIIDWTEIPDEIGEPVQATVIANNFHYTLYINNVFVDEFEDRQLTGSSIGIEATTCKTDANGSFAFDNFQLRTPVDSSK